MARSSPLTGWPVRIEQRRVDGSRVVLRPLTRRDAQEWTELRARNRAHLAPWEASAPGRPEPDVAPEPRHRDLVKALDRAGAASRMLPFVVEYEGALAGAVWITEIEWGSLRGGSAGYWMDEALAGRGIMTLALALAVDYALGAGGLHRIEVNVQAHNVPSLRVVEKVGFRDEGVRRAFQYVDGAWRDHRTFALTAEDVAGRRLADRLL